MIYQIYWQILTHPYSQTIAQYSNRVETSKFPSVSISLELRGFYMKGLDAVHSWCVEWGFTVSLEKTVVVLFMLAKPKDDISLTFNGNPVRVEATAKFLGVVFDSKLTWQAYIDYVTAKYKKCLKPHQSSCWQWLGSVKTDLVDNTQSTDPISNGLWCNSIR